MSGVVNQTTTFMNKWIVHTDPSISLFSIFIILYFKIVKLPLHKMYEKTYKDFHFWYGIGADTTQAVVYNETLWPIIVDAVLEGYNGIMDEWMDW